MSSPFIFVGVGGSGGKTLRSIKAELSRALDEGGWDPDKTKGFPLFWQFLQIDTPFLQDGGGYPAEMLDSTEYVGLVQNGVSLDAILSSIESRNWIGKQLDEIMAPLPAKGSYTGPIDTGAGQFRAIGRTVAIGRLDQIRQAIKDAFGRVTQGDAIDQLAEWSALQNQEVSNKITVILVSSVAGGSGAGQFLDVSEAIKAADPTRGEFYSQVCFLYAPDVFESVVKSKAPSQGIAPNSLAAVNELVSGFYRQSRTEPTTNLYQSFSFQAVPASMPYNVGPKTVFLVGKTNGQVTFSDQHDVYQAAAISISKWALDPLVAENINNYLITNAPRTSDKARLRVPNHLPAPLNAIGFSRVTLGLQSLKLYSAQRLARDVVTSLSVVPNLKDGQLERNAVEETAENAFENFFASSKLDLPSILEGIHPASGRREVISKWSQKVLGGVVAAQTAPRPSSDWAQDFNLGSARNLPQIKSDWDASMQTQAWSASVQDHVLNLVSSSAAGYGLKVTAELVRRMATKLALASKTTIEPIDARSSFGQALQGWASSIQGKVDSQDPRVTQAGQGVFRKIEESLETDSKTLALKLAGDISENFLAPLAESLEEALTLLKLEKDDTDYDGSGVSKFASWPSEGPAPAAFEPAPNERFLIPTANYPGIFESLLVKSTGESNVSSAKKEAISDVVVGSDRIPELKGSQVAWSAFGGLSKWVPRTGVQNAASRWRGKFTSSLKTWESVSLSYLGVPGREFDTYTSKTLAKWLSSPNDSVEKRNNEVAFVAAFTSALSTAKPFAKLNPDLLSVIHGSSQPDYFVQLSEIPVDENSPVGSELVNALVQAKLWDDNTARRFKPGSTTKEIDIFTVLGGNVQHFVFDNLLSPVSEKWTEAKSSFEARQSFMFFRRTRNLPESVPLAPEVLDQIIRGWFVAKALNRLQEQVGEPGMGPRLAVWNQDPAVSAFESLPYPLMFDGETPQYEYPAAVVASVSLAILDCANTKNLAPLSPYHSLMDLGGLVGVDNVSKGTPLQISAALRAWIASGTLGGRTPDAARAGEVTGDAQSRQKALLAFFQKEKATFERQTKLEDGEKPTKLIWEVRREVLQALDELARMVQSASVEESGI